MDSIKIPASSTPGPFFVKLGSFDEEAVPQLKNFTVPDLEEASRVCRAFIDEEDLGSKDWAGGEVVSEESGLCVAVVSYNGRVWIPENRGPEGLPIPSQVMEYDLDA